MIRAKVINKKSLLLELKKDKNFLCEVLQQFKKAITIKITIIIITTTTTTTTIQEYIIIRIAITTTIMYDNEI